MPPFHANSPLSCLLGALTLLMLSQPLVADPRIATDPEALYWQAAMARLEIPVIRSVGAGCDTLPNTAVLPPSHPDPPCCC